ncbi:MAG: glycoside hydrolase family 15 protein, partial [Bdellovibrionales bacterium]|nr:glycoside hydrolase family 15 protein [Bdellovibrionales bacterium]
MPRPDSAPVFGMLLDPGGGDFSIAGAWEETEGKNRQYYMENSNVLVTEIEGPSGDAFRIIDFCPRFEQFGRIYRPASVFRIVEPLAGAPQIVVRC